MGARSSEATHPDPPRTSPGSPSPGSRAQAVSSAETPEPSVPYVRYGVPAGIVGASLVALFFLAVDAAAGRPLATPNALGTALFLGGPLDLSLEPRAVVVLGYTAVHGAVFVALGCLGAIAISTARQRTGPTALAGALAAAFFVFCEAVFLGFAGLFGLPVANELGFGRITAANGLAAAGMGILLARITPSGAGRPTRGPSPADAARRREDATPAIDSAQLRSPPSGREDPGDERS